MIPTIPCSSLLQRAGFDPVPQGSSAMEVGAALDPQPARSQGCSPVQKQSSVLGEPWMSKFYVHNTNGRQILPAEGTITPARRQRSEMPVQADPSGGRSLCINRGAWP